MRNIFIAIVTTLMAVAIYLISTGSKDRSISSSLGTNKSMENLESPCDSFNIPTYSAYKSAKPPVIDGFLDEEIWSKIPKSNSFVDLVSGRNTIHDTHAAVTWDDDNLYVAYWIEEPNVQATLTERDAPIYKNNDVELFIAGKDSYYEFEINSFGTIYEVFFVWKDAYEKQGFDKLQGLTPDEKGRRIFNGVGYRHPRGRRVGFWKWDLEGLETAVQVDGTINDDTDRDRGWTVELKLPWKSLSILNHRDNERTTPPINNDVWRMDFSRFNQYKEAPPADDNGGWAWSPHGVWDSHVPECFTKIVFKTQEK